jgi:phosphoenolpyruvate synthase/pyruvate phosphate dikinase
LNELREYQKRMAARQDLIKPHFDLDERRLLMLTQQRKGMITAYGGKSANLGEVMHAHLPGIVVPQGFSIPFAYYDDFLRQNGFDEAIFGEMLNDQKFVHDPAYRRQRLKEMRERLQRGKMDEQLRRAILQKVELLFPGKGVFVRSSSNSEDLPNFSGAGLYSTVPNARGAEQILAAIKTVWASLWNFEAYEARERAGVDHSKIFMAVLIQEGVNSESSGVMITTDPFAKENKGVIYISAKQGLGSKVVEGPKVAEQVIYNPVDRAVQVLTRSAEDSLLTFDEHGGLKEIPIAGERRVLTDNVIQRLVRAAMEIKRVFGDREQDIEWAYMKGQLYIVQSRAFIAGG